MSFSQELLEDAQDIWEAQMEHPFVGELADGTLKEGAFRHWIKQDYRYLIDYARVFALASARARKESRMSSLIDIANSTLNVEMDLHREFASGYGISAEDLEDTQKAPLCQAYTDFLVRTAHEGSLAEISAAVYPCGQGFLDIADHAASLASEEHRYTPWIEMYTGDEFREVVDDMRDWVDECAREYPGEHDAMREAFFTSARLEYAFWGENYNYDEDSVFSEQ